MSGRRLAFVLPRYDESIGGGAETLVGSLAMQLASLAGSLGAGSLSDEIETVEIWATCAKDHRTWENHFPEGELKIANVVVRRFPVDERNLEVFIRSELQLQQGRPLSVSQQMDWLENSVNSRALYQHIREQGASFDALFFAPYLFATSFWGALIHPERSYLFPCLHDESYAYFEVFRHLFARMKGLIFNAAPEQELAERLYGKELAEKSSVVGMGFTPYQEPLPAHKNDADYIIFSGRKETGKNLDLLLDWFEEYRRGGGTCDLHLIGSGSVEFRESLPEGVSDFGFVSEEEKLSRMKGARALIQLSRNESFSIVMMEAWLVGTPVIVHADCPVTRDHVVRSGGGLYAGSEEEFSACLKYLMESEQNRDALAIAGERYVREIYSWPVVTERFLGALRR